jgi:hypothetical protein
MRRKRDRHVREDTLEADSFGGKAIESRRATPLEAIASQPIGSQRVDGDE